MKILKICLENFQGIKELTVTLDGKDAKIYGDNGTGKTTIYNAFTWLLFDKASTGIKNFTPKTKDANGQDVHYLTNKVEATLQLADGSIHTFTKALSEIWKRKRGSATDEFSGHTTDYYIDGVPISEREYKERVDEICSPDQAKILTMTSFFPEELPWQDRRKVLLEICGDVTDDDVIASDPELQDLKSFLLIPGTNDIYHPVDDFIKIANSKRAEINKELTTIPARIDEAQKAIPDLRGIKQKDIDGKISKLTAQKADIEKQIANMSEDSAITELRKTLSNLELTLSQEKNKHLTNENARLETAGVVLRQLKNERFALENKQSDITEKISRTEKQITQLTSSREKLVADFKTEQEKEWTGDTECYACGQALPAKQIASAKEKFNKAKSDTLEAIRNEIEASCSKKAIALLEKTLQEAKDEEADIKEQITKLQAKITSEQSNQPTAVAFESTEIYTKMQAEIDEVRNKILTGANNTTEAKKALQGQIDDLQEQLQEQTNLKSKFTVAEAQEKRIAELEQNEKTLSEQYEHIQHGVYLCECFIKAKVAMITEKINEKFNSVKFRLFVQQINGGVKEDCEVLVPTQNGLVPFAVANNAARINAGIEIINALSKHWDLYLPLFIDNRESIVRLKESDTQIISLIVSEPDKELRIEVC